MWERFDRKEKGSSEWKVGNRIMCGGCERCVGAGGWGCVLAGGGGVCWQGVGVCACLEALILEII